MRRDTEREGRGLPAVSSDGASLVEPVATHLRDAPPAGYRPLRMWHLPTNCAEITGPRAVVGWSRPLGIRGDVARSGAGAPVWTALPSSLSHGNTLVSQPRILGSCAANIATTSRALARARPHGQAVALGGADGLEPTT